MGIDVRAVCGCSLGTLISAQISDDYIQGQGLVKCQGSCEISGVITPAIGTAVTFTYTKGGVTRTIPRRLRVLSSFADPFRRTTRVELGCKLTYLSDLREKIDWSVYDDPTNSSLDATDRRLMVLSISAASVMDKCLEKLGITASQNPLTSRFLREKFDYSPGYVQVLSDLLVSESWCGYLDLNEELQVFTLNRDGGTGPVLDSSKIIDVGPIGAGALPGEAVVVSFTTYRIAREELDPEDEEQADPSEDLWERSEQVGPLQEVTIPYRPPGASVTSYWRSSGRTTTTTTTSYRTIGGRDVKDREVTETTGPVSSQLDTLIGQYLNAGLSFGDFYTTLSRDETTYTYDEDGQPTGQVVQRFVDMAVLYGALSLPYTFADGSFIEFPSNTLVSNGYRVTEFQNSGGLTRTIVSDYKPWAFTQQGQQGVAQAGAALADDPDGVNSYISYLADSIVHDGTTISTDYTPQAPARPSQVDLSAERWRRPASLAAGVNEASSGSGTVQGFYAAGTVDGRRLESTAELELALGSPTAQRRIELSLPYAPDDRSDKVTISSGGSGTGNTGSIMVSYKKVRSQAEVVVNRYGRVQNRLLLGNRSGVSLQLEPERLPAAPFAPLVVQANGLSALYRVNAASWTLSAEGCIASTDALFWGAVGGTGAFWFPVAPGITALPTAPAVVDTTPSTVLGTVASTGANAQTTLNTAFPAATDGQGAFITATQEFWVYDGDTSLWVNVGSNPGPTATAGGVVPVWNETVKVEAGLRIGATVRSLAYPLAITTTVPPISTRIGASVRKVVLVEVPTAAVTVAALPPMISTGAAVRVPVAGVSLQALPPTVEATAPGVVNVPAAVVNLAALPPMISTGVVVQVPAAAVAISALAPAVQTITAVQVPAAAVTVAALAPTLDTRTPIFSKVSLLLPFDGTNGSQAFTDASSYAVAVTANGNAQISTAQSVFGGASGLFDGNNDYLTLSSSGLNLGTGDFTIEWRMRRAGNTATGSGSSQVLLDARTAEPSTQLNVYISNSTLGYVLTVYVNGSVVITGTAATLDTWIACALCRASGVTRLYMAGSQVGSSYTDSNSYTGTSWTIAGRFAAVSGDYRSFNGYLDDLRIAKGVALMSGTSYTVSSNPHPTA